MHAIRSIPLISRPSRPSSPAPTSTQVTATGTVAAPAVPNAALPGLGKSRSRSLSRQVADKLAPSTAAAIAPSQPVGAVTKKDKGPSPPGSRAATPRVPSSPLPPPADVPVTGGNMDVIGLRLNDVVNKACVGVDFKSKKGFKAGAGWSVGAAVVNEFPAPPADAYLLRAILRTAVRALSIYLGRLESLLLPAITDASFAAPLGLVAGQTPLNPAQAFAVSVAHAAWETCEKLEQAVETGRWPRFVEDALRPTMEKFDLVVGKVVKPLLLSLKADLENSLARPEGSASPKAAAIATVPAPQGLAHAMSREHSSQPAARLAKEASNPGHARQLAVPPCLQPFAARVDGAHRVLELVAAPCQHDGEGWTTKVVVAVAWKGMRLIAERDLGTHGAYRPPSPGSVAKALAGLGKDPKEVANGAGSTPLAAHASAPSAMGGVTAKLANPLSILPSRAQSRPPSPPRRAPQPDPSTHALLSLESLIRRLVGALVQPPNSAPTGGASTEDQEAQHIAREALAEAVEALQSFRTVTAAMHPATASARILASLRRIRDDIDDELEEALDDALEDLPAVVLFSTLLRRANTALVALPARPAPLGEKAPAVADHAVDLRLRGPCEALGWTRADFERQVLAGFMAAEEWGARVANALKPEVERVMSRMLADCASRGDKPPVEVVEAIEWVKALGVALDARAGVKVDAAV